MSLIRTLYGHIKWEFYEHMIRPSLIFKSMINKNKAKGRLFPHFHIFELFFSLDYLDHISGRREVINREVPV